MTESGSAAALACVALVLLVMQAKQMSKMQREIDLIVKGDLETLKLKRKLDGYPDTDRGD